MKPLIILAALAAAALVLRRNRPAVVDADDSEVVGMPTTWSVSQVGETDSGATWRIDWDAWFDTAARRN